LILANRWPLALLTLPLLAVAPPALADWVLPPGAAARLNGGTAALGCSDVINGGTITLAPGGAVVAVRNATTLTTGTLALDDGRLELAAEAIGALSRHSSAPPPPAASSLRPQEHRRMRDLHAFLSTGEADDLSLDDIARHAGLNANSLQKQFRALYGTTVFDFIRQTRLQRARQALERDGLTVGQAALMAGYTSAANFATAYRRCFGISPKQSRARV